MSIAANDVTTASSDWVIRLAEREAGVFRENGPYHRNGRERLAELAAVFGTRITAFQASHRWDELCRDLAFLAVSIADLVFSDRGPENAATTATALLGELGFSLDRDAGELHAQLQGAVSNRDVEELAGLLRRSFRPPQKGMEATWSNEKNARRCQLIDKEIEDTITPDEKIELSALQKQMLSYRRRVAPLPIEDARRLHEQLLQKRKEGA